MEKDRNGKSYIISIDQSTQGTKALLFDETAALLDRADMAHQQKISKEGYISHNPEEIWENTRSVLRTLFTRNQIKEGELKGIGISNQRETTVAWDRRTGRSVCDAVVWQCARAEKICEEIKKEDKEYIWESTGIPLSPYFPAAKMAWILRHEKEAAKLAESGDLCLGTIDSYLLFRLSNGTAWKTDYSNASRTQLFHLDTLLWDKRICEIFQIPMECLPKVCDSNSLFCMTDLGGLCKNMVPVYAVLGDSHGALYGQGCHAGGQVKATYGTGSSLMMNTGEKRIRSKHGLVTSLAWKISGEACYVLEGNINYTGAVITWLKDELQLITSAKETEQLAREANPEDETYLLPAFSGLGAPYWNSEAKAMLYGMRRGTGKKEIVKAGLECIAYQITDVLEAMEQDSEIAISRLCVDGGPTRNGYLMQFQSDMAQTVVAVAAAEEMSGLGAAYLAGITMGVFTKEAAFARLTYQEYRAKMEKEKRKKLYGGWKEVLNLPQMVSHIGQEYGKDGIL